jgi:hypothetical protein
MTFSEVRMGGRPTAGQANIARRIPAPPVRQRVRQSRAQSPGQSQNSKQNAQYKQENYNASNNDDIRRFARIRHDAPRRYLHPHYYRRSRRARM